MSNTNEKNNFWDDFLSPSGQEPNVDIEATLRRFERGKLLDLARAFGKLTYDLSRTDDLRGGYVTPDDGQRYQATLAYLAVRDTLTVTEQNEAVVGPAIDFLCNSLLAVEHSRDKPSIFFIEAFERGMKDENNLYQLNVPKKDLKKLIMSEKNYNLEEIYKKW